ncbi:MAG: hypothetical protein PVH30_04485 [Desulfobacterales bacterium]|jgi:hypothetical protein
MNIIFFPFTHIDTHHARQLFRAAGPFHLMIPLEPPEGLVRLQREGLIRLLHPSPEVDPSVQSALAGTLAWASGHTEKEIRDFPSFAGVSPFFSDPSVHDIRSAIVSPNRAPEKTDDETFRDKLILTLAHRLDQQQRELTRDLQALVESETTLNRWLSEEGPESHAISRGIEPSTLPDPFELKMGDRLRAWARLAFSIDGLWDGEIPMMLLTDSREAFEMTVDALQGLSEQVRRFPLPAETPPGDGRALQSALDTVFRTGGEPEGQPGAWGGDPSSGSEDEGMVVAVWDACIRSPFSVLGDLAGVDVGGTSHPPDRRIWIGHIRWSRDIDAGLECNNSK